MDHKIKYKTILSVIAILLLLSLLKIGGANLATIPTATAQGNLLADYTGDLVPGETVNPFYQLFGSQNKNVNIKMQVPAVAGDGTIDLTVTDGSGGAAFTGTIRDGETLWATFTLKPGINTFSLQNTSGGGGPTLDYHLWLYELDDIPYTWSGSSQGVGTWRSHIRLDFAASGLYQFDFGVTAGRYQFQVDNDYIQKTVEASGTVNYYVPAGIHNLYIEPDSTVADTAWSLSISGPGAAADTLPYTKTGGDLGGAGNDFDEEWLPLQLNAITQANFALTLTGADTDALDVYVKGPGGSSIYTATGVYGGETLWWTADLSAGGNLLQLVADPANTSSLAYNLTVHALPTLSANWAGTSNGLANNSKLRFKVATPGLYEFSYGVTTGRYQFIVNADVKVRKTVESAGTVSYYLGAGTHNLTILQDPNQAQTTWSLGITATGNTYNTLPYEKMGGDLGGTATGNVFLLEWLPLNIETGGAVNVELTLTGDLADGLRAYLYRQDAQVAVYTTPLIYGGETFWWTTELTAGINQIKLLAPNGNVNPLQYDLTIRALPSPTTSWSGVAKGTGGNSVARVSAPVGKTYHVTLETPVGFAQVIIDDMVLAHKAIPATGQIAEFDVPLSAGNHFFKVQQSTAYATTEWTLEVASNATLEPIAQLAGNLDGGVQVDPQIPLFGSADKEVNFRLVVGGGGGPLDLTITDGIGGTAFTGTAYDGETLWGSAVLKPGQNTFSLLNTGGSSLVYDLTVYEIDSTPYDWEGASDMVGTWNSHIKLNFPSDGLYTFAAGLGAGRYQFLVDNDYVQKTVETDGTVSYFVPAGSHVLTILPDRSVDTAWSLNISDAGATTDSLPYHKTGGYLWNTAGQFNEEWLPVDLANATEANFELVLNGNNADRLDVYLYEATGTTPVHTVTGVHGGETLWWTADLPAGLSRVQLVADAANTGPLAYDITIYEKPLVTTSTGAAWAGESDDDGNNSQVRFQIDAAGLYDFAYDVTEGRYQFLVDSDAHIQKTVEMSGTVRYYLSAGTHDLQIVQDTAQASTTWSLEISATSTAYDSLPYTKSGGNLGGTGNDFDQEWLPLNLLAGEKANFHLSLTGQLADGAKVYLYHGSTPTPVFTTPVVYGGETFWWTTDLASGVNQIQVVAEGANTNILEYELTIESIPTIVYNGPYNWSGLAKNTGGHSEIELQIPVSGTYHVVVDIPRGFVNVLITEASAMQAVMGRALAPQQSHYEFSVPLREGGHLFTTQQSATYITTTWAITVSMEETSAPLILSVSPNTVTNNITHTLTITGANFQPNATVEINGMSLSPVTRFDSTMLQAPIPVGTPSGLYTVTVTNPDGQSDDLPNALQVFDALAPEVTAVTPTVFINNIPHPLTIMGANFQTGATVKIDGITLSPVTYINSTELQTLIPAGMPAGTYTVTVTNLDNKSGSLPNALQIKTPTYTIYLPLVCKLAQ